MTTCNKNKEDRHWSHAGLLMQGRLKDRKEKRDNKDTLIKQITAITASDLYRLAFDRWLLQTYESETFNDSTPKFATVSAQVNGRLLIGLTRDNVLETSVTTQHAYGMPMLPGSAVKGAVRAYAEQLFCQKKGNKVVIEADENGIERTVIDRSWQPTLDILFGIDETVAQSSAGYLIWHDAWWIPDLASKKLLSNHKDQTNSSRPFVSDIVTVHHQQYYACVDKMCEALEIEPPIPNKQLAVQGNFYFVIEGSQSSWVTFAKQLLEDTLQQFGLGAKGASGYGYFIKNEKLNQQLQQHYVVLRGYDKKN